MANKISFGFFPSRWLSAVLCLIAALGLPVRGQTTADDSSVPNRDISVSGNSITVSYYFPEFQEVTAYPDSTTIFHTIPGFGRCSQPGRPMLPMRIDTFRVPDGYTVSLSSTVSNQQFVRCDYAGALIPTVDSSDTPPVRSQIVVYSGYYPEKPGTLINTYELRGETLAEVMVSPVQYDHSSGIAILNKQFSYTLTFTPEASAVSEESEEVSDIETHAFNSLDLKNSYVANLNTVGGINLLDEEGFEGSVGYLIVTTDKYLNAVNNFVTWKKYLGYTVHVLSRPEWTSSTEVKNTIRNYRREHSDIKYLLILGDHQDVPATYSYWHRTHVTDIFYGNTYENTYVPDVYMGRIPVNTLEEAEGVLNKLVRHEMCPPLDTNFYLNSSHIARFEPDDKAYFKVGEAQPFVYTCETIRNYVRFQGISASRIYSKTSDADPKYYSSEYSYGEALPYDLLPPRFKWDGQVSDIVSAFNKGDLYIAYRGHGINTGWGNVGFTQHSLSELSNYELYPTVFSITCHSGNFTTNCFAEQLLKLPFSGASCVIAATEESYSGWNDSLLCGMIDAIWPSPGLIPKFTYDGVTTSVSPTPAPTYRIGQILEQGLYRMRQQWWSTDPTYKEGRYHYEVYHIFGDPSMYFHTSFPKQFSDVEIVRDQDGIYVSTNGEQASISFYNSQSDTARKFETDEVFYPTTDEKNTVICITGHNHQTYLDGISIPIPADEQSESCKFLYCKFSNPTTLSVELIPSSQSEETEIIVVDIMGRVIYEKAGLNESELSAIEIPLPSDNGVYVINLIEGGTVVDSRKIIK